MRLQNYLVTHPRCAMRASVLLLVFTASCVARATEPQSDSSQASAYWISTHAYSWDIARNACRICLGGGELLQLSGNVEQQRAMLWIVHHLVKQTLNSDVGKLWVGGYLYHHTFKWTNDPGSEPRDEKTLGPESFRAVNDARDGHKIHFLAKEPPPVHHNCLAMYVTQHDVTLAGQPCEEKMHFVCRTHPDVSLHVDCKGEMAVAKSKRSRRSVTGSLTSKMSRMSVTGLTPPPLRHVEKDKGIVKHSTMAGIPYKSSWLSVSGYNNFWINTHEGNWSDAQRACKECLRGELLKLVTVANGQQDQMRMIDEAMRRTLHQEFSRIWIGRYEFDSSLKWPKQPSREPGASSLPPIVKEYDGRPSYLQNRCAALSWQRGRAQIVGDKCTDKRHAICHTSEANPASSC